MSTEFVNASPKTRFQESGQNLSKHRSLVESTEFQKALDVAMLQYNAELASKCTDANAAMRLGLCILGAQEFVAVLKNLGVTPVAPTRKPSDNLTPTN